MADISFDTLAEELRLDIPGMVDALAVREVRNAAIDFCNRTRCWKFEQDTITTSTETEYDMEPPSGSVVSEVIRVKYAANVLEGKPYEVLLDYATNSTMYYGVLNPRVLKLAGTPVADKTLDVMVALKPSISSRRIEDYIYEEYSEVFRHGALARLFAMAGKPWTNTTLSGYHSSEYESAVTTATTKCETGGVRTAHTVKYGGL